MRVEYALRIKEELFREAQALTQSKGLGYGVEEDTFKNMRLVEWMGICPAYIAAYIRMLDKVFRLGRLLQNKDIPHEGLRDTVIDLVNYAMYVYILKTESEGLQHES